MLGKLFAKKNFEEIDYYLEATFKALGIDWSKVKIRKKPATYGKPYTLLAEANHQGHHLIVSLWSPPLSDEKTTAPKLDLICTLENKDWLYLNIFHADSTPEEKQVLDTIKIPFLDQLQEIGVQVETNNKFFVLEQFDDTLVQRLLRLHQVGFERMKIDRQKIYLQTPWLPHDSKTKNDFTTLLKLLLDFATLVD